MTKRCGPKPIRILLVEDDDGDAKALQRAFAKASIPNPIIRAMDGVEALEILRGENGRTKPDSPLMLLVDLNMPRMGGIELIEALRADAGLRHLVVFILTTSDSEEDRRAAANVNVAGYIVKGRASLDILGLINITA